LGLSAKTASHSFVTHERKEMEALLNFFSDLILFTAGLFVLFLWIGLLVILAIEIYDSFHETPTSTDEDLEIQ
jgi:hypothetical protein